MKKRVLLVDDDFAVLAGLAGVLVSEGYSVVHAADADEAIEIFREDRSFDIVLLDLNMPRKGGHEVLAELKADPALACIPVAIVTGNQNKSAELHMPEFPMTAFAAGHTHKSRVLQIGTSSRILRGT